MKTYIASLLRHAFTALAGLGAYLLSFGWINQGDVAQVDAAGAAIGGALTVILTAIGGRLLLSAGGKLFAAGAGEKSGGGTLPAWIIGVGLAAGSLSTLPSCTPDARAEAFTIFKGTPVRTCVTTDYGTACYSSKRGIEIDVDATSGK